MKSVEEYLTLPYSYILKQEDDGTYFIRVKELVGCMSLGDTKDEAFSMIEDAMREWIQYHLDVGISVPEPEEEIKSYSGKFVVRVTPELHKELAMRSKEQGVSLNHLVTESLSRTSGIITSLKETINQLTLLSH